MPRRKGLPELGELILCTVQRISPYAAWCKLEEYPEVEGMIHVSEVSGKWVHDIREFVKVNKQYVAKVVKIDQQKKFVNLSLKRVSEGEKKEKMNSYRKEQRAEKILEQVAKEFGKSLEQAYEEVGFLLQEKFGELHVAFEEIKKSPEILVKKGVPEEWVKALAKAVEKSLKEKEVKVKAELELKSYASDGIKKIKEILLSLEKKGIKVKYISAPRYRVEIEGKNPKALEKKLVEILENTLKEIKNLDGEGSYRLIK
ncbi:MAG: translation initiation factor IF-2 subunit alpha [Candidatus Aenigmarchaeota archaeon]|nr:translation initiation factor IF-2 subunit alpha [Candidatus Aenigmarchaeota archaeon]